MEKSISSLAKSRSFFKIIGVLVFVYLFLFSIGLMGSAFKGFGEEFARQLIQITSNPVVGLFIGILATSIVQSSSTTTSITVGMVSSGALTVSNAIPIIMGANIGTTITCFIVALSHFTRREEFRRAISGAAVLVFFCIFCVLILFPLEIWTGFLQKSALWMVDVFEGFGGVAFISPLEAIIQPVVILLEDFLLKLPFLSDNLVYFSMLTLAITFLIVSLYYIIKIMRSLVLGKIEAILNNVFDSKALVAILFGFITTAAVQSSSITTSLMIPFVAAGILKVEAVFPMFLGAKLGSTTTTILASFATGNAAAITVAFVHFLFSLIGVFVIYPVKSIRSTSIRLTHYLGRLAYKKRRYAVAFVLVLFFLTPGIVIFLSYLANN